MSDGANEGDHGKLMRVRRNAPLSTHSTFIAPQELATRWRCSRSTVDRIAHRAGFRRVCLGEGRNGIVRYLLSEVEAFEAARRS